MYILLILIILTLLSYFFDSTLTKLMNIKVIYNSVYLKRDTYFYSIEIHSDNLSLCLDTEFDLF